MPTPRPYEGPYPYPEGPEDHDGIIGYIEQIVTAQSGWKTELNRSAMRNILYATGNQWLSYDYGLQVWRPSGLRKAVPRPVTNKIGPLMETTVSRLVRFKPPITYRPGGFENKDIVSAGVGDDINKIVERETKIRRLKPLVARWVCTTGNAFLINGYDTSPETGADFVQGEQCIACGNVTNALEIEEQDGHCPGCGDPGTFKPAIDEQKQPIGEFIPRGRHTTEVQSLFTSTFDPTAQFIEDSAYFAIVETVPEDIIVTTYGADSLDGVPRDSAASLEALAGYYLSSLAYPTSNPVQGFTTWTYADTEQYNRVRRTRVWFKPRYDKAPEGIYAVILGDKKVVESKPWAYHEDFGVPGSQEKPFLPVVHIKFNDRIGSAVGRTRMDDLITLQDERNLIQSHFLLHTRRMSNAIWLIPTGSGIQKMTGETGPVYSYNPVPGAHPPTRVAGVNPPEFLVRYMDMKDQELDIVWGTYEIGRGQVPERGSDLAFVSLQMLAEKAEEAQQAVTENWTLGWLEWSRQHIHIWREYARADRTLAVGGGKWAVKTFNRASLSTGIDMDVDIGLFRPRSHIAMRGTLQQLFNWGILDANDPQMRFRIYQLMGLPELMEDYRLDWTQANQENDAFMEWAQSVAPVLASIGNPFGGGGEAPEPSPEEGSDAPPERGGPPAIPGGGPGAAPMIPPPPLTPPMPWENHMVQIFVHRELLQTDGFRELPEPLKIPMVQHMMLHVSQLQPTGSSSQPGQGAEEEREGNPHKRTNQASQPNTTPEGNSEEAISS